MIVRTADDLTAMVRERCGELGLTQEQLADIIGVHRVFSQAGLAARCFLRHDRVSAFERGCATPTLQELLLLAHALGVSVGELTDGLATPTRTVAGRGYSPWSPSNPRSRSPSSRRPRDCRTATCTR